MMAVSEMHMATEEKNKSLFEGAKHNEDRAVASEI